MTVNTSLVPTLTRADLLRIAAWTTANARARKAYRKRREDLERAGPACAPCWNSLHSSCRHRVGKARMSLCICDLTNHETRNRP